jgi:hypothetical protein
MGLSYGIYQTTCWPVSVRGTRNPGGNRLCVSEGLSARGGADAYDVTARINNFAVIRMRAEPLFSVVVYNDMAVLPTTKTQNIYQPLFLVCTAHFSFSILIRIRCTSSLILNFLQQCIKSIVLRSIHIDSKFIIVRVDPKACCDHIEIFTGLILILSGVSDVQHLTGF